MTTEQRVCLMCGQDDYGEVVSISQPIGLEVLGIGSIGDAKKWRVKRCPNCGNVQLFLIDDKREVKQ